MYKKSFLGNIIVNLIIRVYREFKYMYIYCLFYLDFLRIVKGKFFLIFCSFI